MQNEVLNSSPWYSVETQSMAKSCIHQGRFMLDMGEILAGKVVKPWNWLSEEVVDALCLSVFKRVFKDNIPKAMI